MPKHRYFAVNRNSATEELLDALELAGQEILTTLSVMNEAREAVCPILLTRRGEPFGISYIVEEKFDPRFIGFAARMEQEIITKCYERSQTLPSNSFISVRDINPDQFLSLPTLANIDQNISLLLGKIEIWMGGLGVNPNVAVKLNKYLEIQGRRARNEAGDAEIVEGGQVFNMQARQINERWYLKIPSHAGNRKRDYLPIESQEITSRINRFAVPEDFQTIPSAHNDARNAILNMRRLEVARNQLV